MNVQLILKRRRRGGGTAGPMSIGGLVLLADADAGIVLNGANVASAADQSSGGASLAQGTAANQPLWSVGAVNGHHAITPNDANDRIVDTAKPDLSNLSGYTSFIVYKLTGAALLTRTAEASAAIADALQNDGTNNIRFVNAANTGSYAFSSTAAYHINEALYDGTQSGNANRLQVFHDGTAQTLTFAGTIPATTGAGCAGYQLGHSVSSGGSVAYVAIYNRPLTTIERGIVGRFLGTRFGISTTY